MSGGNNISAWGISPLPSLFSAPTWGILGFLSLLLPLFLHLLLCLRGEIPLKLYFFAPAWGILSFLSLFLPLFLPFTMLAG